MNLKAAYDRWVTFAETPHGKRVGRYIRGGFIAGIVGLLIYQLSGIGWTEIWHSLPTHPLYYVLLLALYMLLPVTESVIYGRLWRLRMWECLPIMIRKRVLNMDVIGYSGEVYFFAWAKERVRLPSREIMATIKDNLILSSGASIGAAVLLLVGLAAGGQIRLSQLVDNPNPLYIGLACLGATLIGTLIFRFRDAIFSLPRRIIAAVGVTHLLRFFVGYALQVAQWWVVLPSASFETWAILLTVFVLINRIPFLPSSDLVFVSAGAGISPLLDVPVASVVAMLLVRSAIDRLLNILLFTTTVWRERRPVYREKDRVGAAPDQQDAGDIETGAEIPVSLNS